MDDGTKAQIREMIREANLSPGQLEQVRKNLRSALGWVAAMGTAFLLGAGVLSYSAGYAGISAKIIEDGVQDTIEDLQRHTQRARDFADDGFPLGSIIAWHSNILRKVNPLPDDPLQLELGSESAWLACNGQTLKREDHGEEYECLFASIPKDVMEVKIPDLNHVGRFLRGGLFSGTEQDDAIKTHTHKPSSQGGKHYWVSNPGPLPAGKTGEKFADGQDAWNTNFVSSTGENINAANETRPKNMSVVWIIRVK